MRNSLMLLFVLALFGAVRLRAQGGGGQQILPTTVDPTGLACTAQAMRLLTPGGTIFTCQSGTFAAVSGGGTPFSPGGSVALNKFLVGTSGSAYGWRAITSTDIATALSPLTGVVKAISGVLSASASADIIALWSGTCNSASLLGGAGSCVIAAGLGANSFTAAQTITITGLGTTPTDALETVNTTAAAAGAQQVSPYIHQQGQGWKTTSTAASQPVDFFQYLLPVQGSTNPSSVEQFCFSINSGSVTCPFTIDNAGSTTAGGNLTAGVNASVQWNGRAQMQSPTANNIKMLNNLGTSFGVLQFGGGTSSFAGLGNVGQVNPQVTIVDATGGATADLLIGHQKATTGQRFLCIDTNGLLVSSATACVGT